MAVGDDEVPDAVPERPNPFAALQALKKRQGDDKT
jgi:hypothetical protein